MNQNEEENITNEEVNTTEETGENVVSVGEERDKLQENNIVDEVKKSFLDYSMSVIVSRALPDLRDGLKPVHRRILFAMNENNLTPDKQHRKSATIVGDVMGRYHPHGDSSIYDAMVRMAQDYNYRYTLVDGHGNFGNINGSPAAAYRYTEARLAKISMELLRDINKNTVNLNLIMMNLEKNQRFYLLDFLIF